MSTITATDVPAILGGHPTTEMWKSPGLEIGTEERVAVLEVLESKKWWRGGTIKEMADSQCGIFERAFCEWQGAKHGLAVTNGTAAIEAAIKAIGMQEGDEILVPAISFIVTASAISNVSGKVRFVDVDPETMQIDPDALEAAITPKTRGICLVHYGGYPADMERIMPIAHKHNLFVLEDCAHAHGSQLNGIGLGCYGDAGTFSFQQFKTLTAGEGGIIISNKTDVHDMAYSLHHLGRRENSGFYDFEMLAWNLRMTEWQGAILKCQLERVKDQTLVKQENAAWLSAEMRALGVMLPLREDKRITRRGFYSYLLRYQADACEGLHRDDFLKALKAEGISLGRGYNRPIYQNAVYENATDEDGKHLYRDVSCPRAEHICKNEQVTLDHQFLRDRAVLHKLVEAVAKIKHNAGDIRRKLEH
ncbi:MAG: DegT/DnrJ/EryC1/StrS family aminotransferase [Planctomycetes bacterium]|nr:DegT/DnrJ/EryC1/StrS family aminotransferase [Planctomycetota bacterium]